MDIRVISITADAGGLSQKVTLSAVSAQSGVLTKGTNEPPGDMTVLVTVDVACWLRQGNNPVALADGTDIALLANNTYRVCGIVSGNKLAFIAGGAGAAYITPEA